MGKKVRSSRGEMVDFDLLKIKEQMTASPAPTDVRARQDFIEKRMRRRLKKTSPPAPKIHTKEEKDVDVKKKMPGTEDFSEESKMIDQAPVENDAEGQTRSRTTPKQKARPPRKKTEENNED